MSATATRLPETVAGVVTSWLPLITPYPVVNGCNSSWYSPGNPGAGARLHEFDPNDNNALSVTHCLPDVATSWWNQNSAVVVTSLGPFVCPQAYTVATTVEVNGGSSTLTGCCPSGFIMNTIVDRNEPTQCWSTIPAGETFEYTNPTTLANSVSYYTITTTYSTVVSLAGVQVNGYNFVDAVYATATASGFTTSKTSPLVEGATIASTSSQVEAASTQNISTFSTNTGVSTAAKFGIIFSLVFTTIVLSLFAAYLCLTNRRRNKELQAASFSQNTNSPFVRRMKYPLEKGAERSSPLVFPMSSPISPTKANLMLRNSPPNIKRRPSSIDEALTSKVAKPAPAAISSRSVNPVTSENAHETHAIRHFSKQNPHKYGFVGLQKVRAELPEIARPRKHRRGPVYELQGQAGEYELPADFETRYR